MPYCIEPTTFVPRKYHEETLEGLFRASPFQATSMSSASPPIPSCSISSESADYRFATDIPAAEALLEPTDTGYGSMRCGQDRSRCHHEHEFFEPECGCKLSVRTMEDATLVGRPTITSQFGGSSRGEFAYLFSGDQSDGIFYTEDANVKLTYRMRRQCFNCKATETSTWRRSLLSLGKMLCNKCGLFERTHFIPRPEKFPRRKTLDSKSPKHPVRSRKKSSPNGGAVNSPYQDIYHPSPRPLPVHFVDALDPSIGKSNPQDMPRASPYAPDTSLSPPQVLPCYPASEQPILFHVDHQSLPSALSDSAIWVSHGGSLR